MMTIRSCEVKTKIVEADYLTDAITDEAVDFIDKHSEQAFLSGGVLQRCPQPDAGQN